MTTTWLPDVQKTLHLQVGLQSHDAEQERIYAGLVRNIGKSVDRLILTTLSRFELPAAERHPIVLDIIDSALDAGLRVTWGRNLWVAFPEDAERIGHYVQQPGDVQSPQYYADFIGHLEDERFRLGVDSTFADAEPPAESIYTRGPQGVAFKKAGLTGDRRESVLDAIQQAVRQVGMIDYIYPAGGQFHPHFPWTLRTLGREYMHHVRTYFCRAADWENHRRTIDTAESTDGFMRPPAGQAIELHWWGSYVCPTVAGAPERRELTLSEWRSLPVREIMNYFPEMRRGGLWLSAWPHERLAVLRELGEVTQ